jgi:hypothetical protein
VRLRLLAAATIAAAASALPAQATHYDRVCGGTVDVTCKEFSCRAVDCFWYDCTVYVSPEAVINGPTVCV